MTQFPRDYASEQKMIVKRIISQSLFTIMGEANAVAESSKTNIREF